MRTFEEQEEVDAMLRSVLRFIVAQERQAAAMERQAAASEEALELSIQQFELMHKRWEELENKEQ